MLVWNPTPCSLYVVSFIEAVIKYQLWVASTSGHAWSEHVQWPAGRIRLILTYPCWQVRHSQKFIWLTPLLWSIHEFKKTMKVFLLYGICLFFSVCLCPLTCIYNDLFIHLLPLFLWFCVIFYLSLPSLSSPSPSLSPSLLFFQCFLFLFLFRSSVETC